MALRSLGTRILARRTSLLLPQRFAGYIILVPEIGEEAPETNPLLRNDGLPEFSNITIEHCMAAIGKQTLEFEAGVKEIERVLEETDNPNVFKDVFQPLEVLGTPLDVTWGLSKTLYLGNSTLMPTKHYMAIHSRAKRARAVKFNSLPIYETVKQELAKEGASSTDEEERMLRKFALEGRLNGLELIEDSKSSQLKEAWNKLSKHMGLFKHKIEQSTRMFSHSVTDSNVIRDFPMDLLTQTANDAANPMKGPWKFTLQPNVFLPVMEHCHEREIRWNLWQASVSRGSGYGDRDLSTGVHLEEMRHSRRDIANLLGFQSFADMSMETKMAGSVENVQSILDVLRERAVPAQERELDDLHRFAAERGFKGKTIELWDVAYWRRKQLRSLHEFREEDLKDYFPLSRVLDGLFQLTEKLFNVVIKRRSNVSTWHKDVRFYDVFESHSSAPVAGFYIDPYARSEEKIRLEQNTGWMVSIQSQSRITESKPLAALVFNFEAPSGDRQSHLSFREVRHLFHKFGLALQHMLTRSNYSEVSGSSNIEWDAVAVSGHVLSHWLFNESTIDSISCHRDSEDKLPLQLFESLISAQQHLAGLDLSTELYLAALDLELHNCKDYWLDVVKRLWPEYRCFPLDKADSHPCSFTEIFIEEWAAAYYSHVWSRMIAADVYSAFHEVKGDEQKVRDVGKRYRDTFLALGGSSHPCNTFRQFRGRDPSPKALLSSLGLKKLKTGL